MHKTQILSIYFIAAFKQQRNQSCSRNRSISAKSKEAVKAKNLEEQIPDLTINL